MTLLGAHALFAAALLASDEALSTAQPAEVAIGQPITWTLTVEHAAGDEPELPEDVLSDETWFLLAGPRRATVRFDAEGGAPARAETTVHWTVMSLVPGERALPALEVRLASGSVLAAAPAAVRVLGELAEGEDAPRPLTGFRAVEERTGRLRWGRIGLAAFGALALGGAAAILVRRRRRPAAAPPPSARERLDALSAAAAAGELDDFARMRSAAFELAALVRAGVDAACSAPLPAAADEEWLDAVRASSRLSPDLCVQLEELLGFASGVRWGRERPTRFRVGEELARAARVLDELGRAEPPAESPAEGAA